MTRFMRFVAARPRPLLAHTWAGLVPLAFALLLPILASTATDAFAQYRGPWPNGVGGEEDVRSTAEQLERVAGVRQTNEGEFQTEPWRRLWYPRGAVRSGGNAQPGGSYRRAFRATDKDGRAIDVEVDDGSFSEMWLDMDQYYIGFEWEPPRAIVVENPDGTAQVFWYMIYRALNNNDFPVYTHLSFELKTLDEDILPNPDMSPEEQQAYIDKAIGWERDQQWLERRRMNRDEYVRGKMRADAHTYINHPERWLLDRIATKERIWEWDNTGRWYNPLVPSHLFQWRVKLRVVDEYVYPAVSIQDVQGNYWVIQPHFSAGSVDTPLTVRAASYDLAGAPAIKRYASVDAFRTSTEGQAQISLLPPPGLFATPENVTMTLFDAFEKYRPRYQLGDRVDQYGHVIPPGDPRYENGIMIDTADDLKRLHQPTTDSQGQDVVWVKYAAPRRYTADDKVLVNYAVPDGPWWDLKANVRIGEANPVPQYVYVNGAILEAFEYKDEGMDYMQRTTLNRFGGLRDDQAFTGAQTDVSGRAINPPQGAQQLDTAVANEGQPNERRLGLFDDGFAYEQRGNEWVRYSYPWYADGEWQPAKRLTHDGRTMISDYRLYQPGDRVTKLEWLAYAERLPVRLVEEMVRTRRYDPEREYLRAHDLLVGQPRLMLAEYGETTEQLYGEDYLVPRGKSVRGFQQHDNWWRWGFRVDAAGDYAGMAYESLNAIGKRRFEALWANTVKWMARKAQEAANADNETWNAEWYEWRRNNTWLQIVPQFDDLGVAIDYENPLTGERVPRRADPELPDQMSTADEVTVWCSAYEYAAYYLYNHDYERLTTQDAAANYYESGDLSFDMQGLIGNYEADSQQYMNERFNERRGNRSYGARLSDDDALRRIDNRWSDPTPETEFGDQMVGLYRTGDRPTLAAREINSVRRPGMTVEVDREFVKYKIDLDDDNVRIVLDRDPDETNIRNVILEGRVLENPSVLTYKIELTREVRPAYATGVAVFRQVSIDWRWMNVYVTGVKGPIRRDGFTELSYPTQPLEAGANAQRRQLSPRFIREDWVMLLRFERDTYTGIDNRLRYLRRFFYLADNVREMPIRGDEG